jgi:tetratricopeptide (TPR) repeat protein
MYLDEKKYQEAADNLLTLLKHGLDKPQLHYFLAMAFEGLKKIDEAIESFEKVPQTSSYHRSALVRLSFLYQEKGDTKKALSLMNKALEEEPNEPGLYLFLGALYEEMEDYDKAISTLKKGLDLQRDHIRLHFRLGIVYDKAGDKEACIQEMRAVIEQDPSHAEALNYLGYTYAELGTNLDEAEELIKRAMKLKPDDGYITDSLGWVYYMKGFYEEAVKFLEEAAKLVPDDATILEHLGDAHMKVNELEKSLESYRKALENKEKDKAPLEDKIESVHKQLGQDG